MIFKSYSLSVSTSFIRVITHVIGGAQAYEQINCNSQETLLKNNLFPTKPGTMNNLKLSPL